MKVLDGIRAIVIKVESPGGDENRRWPPMSHEGWSANFTSVNRGKRSMALNLKNPGAKEILKHLAAGTDVPIHSSAARQGISLEALQEANPRLVVSTISGYGANGPPPTIA